MTGIYEAFLGFITFTGFVALWMQVSGTTHELPMNEKLVFEKSLICFKYREIT